MHNKLLIIISSPSGGGKSTMCKKLISDMTSPIFNKCEFSVSATTRLPRVGEVEGKDYFFLSQEQFEAKKQGNEFLEHANVFGNSYGTLTNQISKTKHTIFDIDVQGHSQIRQKSSALSIFLLPPSLDILRERIKKRADLTKQDEERRLVEATKEMEQSRNYDFLLINEDIEKTFQAICGIISSAILKNSDQNFGKINNFTNFLESL